MLRKMLCAATIVLAALFGVAAQAAIPQSERDVLIALYNSTGGGSWTTNTGWNGAAGTECSWQGVSCDGTSSHVIGITLSNNNLTGTIPALSGLANLALFDAQFNHLGGTIPVLTGLSNLNYFDVRYNKLTGSIPSLSGLAVLFHFYVDYNQLTGTIPSLASLTNLETFSASSNQLTGTIPSLAGLLNLSIFDTSLNELSGTIPPLTGLTMLKSFGVRSNLLSGPIPVLSGLSNLAYFNVSSNQLTGTIPSLADIPKLILFDVSSNLLTGTIPALVNLQNLGAFNVGANQLTGTIPPLSNLTQLSSFDAYDNQLVGTIPSLAGLTSLSDFEVNSNHLTGPIPALAGLTNLSVFVVHSNQLTGTIPAFTGLTSLLEFNANSNQLTGPIPSFDGLVGFYEFHANSNRLSGTIPSFAGLTRLEIFDVDGNQLSGTIPALTGTDLYDFKVGSNQLTGTIPSLSGLSHLRVFQVGNNLLNGSIPQVPTPGNLTPGFSSLCPNSLAFTPDAKWNAATGLTPWYSTCAAAESNTAKPSTNIALSDDGRIKVFQSQQTDLTSNAGNTGGQDVYSVGADGRPVLESLDALGNKLIGTASLPAVSPDGNVIAFLFTPTAAKVAKDTVTGQMFAGARGQPKHQVDVGMGGAPPTGSANGTPSLSSINGSNALVFCSSASNLVPSDSNNARDIFLVDPLNPTVAAQRVSVNSDGTELPGDSCEPKLSHDGDRLAFSLSAPSLYGTTARQIVIKDLVSSGKALITGQMYPITASSTGQGASADSSEPAINHDGSVVAFVSQADLDGLGPPVGNREVFVSLAQNTGSRLIKRLRSGDGSVPNGASQHPQISNDGTTVVMQTSATNFLGAKSVAKADAASTKQCGAVAITTNFFSVASLGSTLCTADGKTLNQNPTISGDGVTAGFDSGNSPTVGASARNAYSQGVGVYPGTGIPNLSGDYSGQWFDPRQSGQGLVIDVTNPDSNNGRVMLLTWFVFMDGQPTWVQGAGVPHAGTGQAGSTVVVQMDQVGIFRGVSFPLGEARASGTLWGSISLTFTDANTGNMSWNTSYPGFTSGSMPIKHFLPVLLPADDPSGAQIKACYSGNWFSSAQVGQGFEFEVVPTVGGPWLSVDWFTFGPDGAPVWLFNAGPISGNSAQMQLGYIDGPGAQFPPGFDSARITAHVWGTAKFTFSDASHAHVAWTPNPGEPRAASYGAVDLDLQPLGTGLLDRRVCH